MRQVTRIVRSETSGSSDEQAATPDDRGSYGELMDAIDELLDEVATGQRERPGRRESSRSFGPDEPALPW